MSKAILKARRSLLGVPRAGSLDCHDQGALKANDGRGMNDGVADNRKRMRALRRFLIVTLS